ncbi:13127_t:CDS:2 [Funneliformis geosporum]|uniref:8152_t:CDS:1 n=1 Tax=Funneliformis geosporum TaxID=1117311 RepID=A0A9W4WWB6_9GLOM|nr:13127_t:CDS:2 [Funneliformis geosporum]CAI2168460.1 8152_t:CDS:2 [Funneliformis geosporum]
MSIQHINNCCGCVRLKAGVLILSILWLIEGLLYSVTSILSLISRDYIDFTDMPDSFHHNRSFFILPAVVYVLITIGAVFGLIAVTRVSIQWLPKYSKVAYGIAGAEVVVHVYLIILTIVQKTSIIEECENYIKATNPQFGYACNQGYNYGLTFSIAYAVVVILLSMYFALVVSAYSYKAREETEVVETKEQAE